MGRLLRVLPPLSFVVLAACAEEAAGGPRSAGAALFAQPFADGNSFACATCHAEREPADDGLRRVGHPLAGVTRRPHFKNGALTDVRDAVNSCLEEWMRAEPLDESDPRWADLHAHLDSLEGDGAPVLYEIAQPPDSLEGGSVSEGRTTFAATCVTCHGDEGAGTVRGPSLKGTTLDAETIAERIRLSGSPSSPVYEGLTGGAMPFWAKDRLSDAELLNVVAYVEALGAEDPGGGDGGDGGGGGSGRECPSTHPSVGKSAAFSTFAHDVSGTATIVDDCTIRIDAFTFDGGGIDVRVYAGKDGDFDPPTGFPLSEDLRGRAFDGETYTVQLPVGRTLDDLDGISVWCVDVGVSFGDALFE